MEFQGQLLTSPRLLSQPLLQLLLLLQQLVDLLVVVEGLPHQLGLGQPGMFELSGGRAERLCHRGGGTVFTFNKPRKRWTENESFALKEEMHELVMTHVV